MKAIVSDSTTLIILQKLDAFYLLSNIFKEVLISDEVKNEAFGGYAIPVFIKVKNSIDTDTISLLSVMLDAGESSTIALALEKNLELIIDEKKGRKIAEMFGVKVMGFLGVLALNVKNGKISTDRAIAIANEAQKIGLYISAKLLQVFEEKLKNM